MPGAGQVFRAVDLALAFAGGRHDRFHHAGEADAAFAFDGRAQGFQRIGEGVGRSRQLQLFRGEAAYALAVHGEVDGAGAGYDPDQAGRFQFCQGLGGDGLDFGYHDLGFLGIDHARQDIAIGHVYGLRAVRHLMPGRAIVTVHRDDLDAQALQGDDHFLAQFSRTQQHDTGGGGGERSADMHMLFLVNFI